MVKLAYILQETKIMKQLNIEYCQIKKKSETKTQLSQVNISESTKDFPNGKLTEK